MNHVLPPDTQAILLLCASFGQNRQTEPHPLTLGEYNSLAGWLRENQKRPADLLHPTCLNLLQSIPVNKLDFYRISALLQRGLMLSLAVEKWTNQGLWILGRSDSQYPKRLKQILQHLAPAILYGIGKIKLLSQGGLAIVGSRHVEASANFSKSADAGENQQLQDSLLEIEVVVTDVEVTHSLTSEIVVNQSLSNSGAEIVLAETEVEASAPEEKDVASNGTSQDAIPYGISSINAHRNTQAVEYPPKDIYEAVLPFILSHLEQPLDDKSIAELLDVQIGQMRLWLKKAVAEGKVIKTNKPVAYVANQQGALLSLLNESA
ncbi:MAG: DNA-processing protein DprA [Microcoleus anatoxicus]|uniref:DNA-processing protein DprA n=1 Tax=Microcoleus anatoxicus TaxID=2705319 RepID=UPI0036734AC7